MKNLTLTSVLALAIACPAFADIATSNNDPKCDNTTIGAYQGSTELEAQWTANKINLNWYGANGQQIQLEEESAPTYCMYSGTITKPSNPSRDGYTFAGWVVRPNAFNMSTLDPSISTTWDEQHVQYRSLIGDDGDNMGSQTGLSDGEWRVKFSYGTVKGIARCASNEGEWATAGTPQGTTGQYCWCQASGFDAESDGSFLAVSSPSWVFNSVHDDADLCAYYCANYCASYVQGISAFRSAVFGVAGD